MINEDFNEFDNYIAEFLLSKVKSEISEKERNFIKDIIKIMSRNLSNGDTCVYIENLESYGLHKRENVEEIIKKTGLGDETGDKPIVIRKSKLYFQKYWKFEKELADYLVTKSNLSFHLKKETFEHINQAFPNKSSLNFQKIAAFVSLSSGLSVISGGPGTGKTTTVAKIIDILLTESDYKVVVAAPTGKAVARVQESINSEIKNLNLQNIEKFPSKAMTIHRLLGASNDFTEFQYNKNNLLPYDVVIVDEVSMVDLILMKSLFDAIKDDARVVLIGDKDQLASVEAGAVLGEICSIDNLNKFTDEFVQKYIPDSGVEKTDIKFLDSFVELRENHRFSKESGLYKISIAVKESLFEDIDAIFNNEKEIEWIDISEKFPDKLNRIIMNHCEKMIASGTCEEAFAEFENLIILTPYKMGSFSVEFFNTFIEKDLNDKVMIRNRNHWYNGKPVVLNGNDYNLNIFNGDVGIYMNEKIYFKESSGFIGINPYLLSDFNTCYALTVHKSQGSEFSNVIFAFGARDSLILNRQLIYTAITRAKEKVYIWGDRALFKKAVKRNAMRMSGLRERIEEAIIHD